MAEAGCVLGETDTRLGPVEIIYLGKKSLTNKHCIVVSLELFPFLFLYEHYNFIGTPPVVVQDKGYGQQNQYEADDKRHNGFGKDFTVYHERLEFCRQPVFVFGIVDNGLQRWRQVDELFVLVEVDRVLQVETLQTYNHFLVGKHFTEIIVPHVCPEDLTVNRTGEAEHKVEFDLFRVKGAQGNAPVLECGQRHGNHLYCRDRGRGGVISKI